MAALRRPVMRSRRAVALLGTVLLAASAMGALGNASAGAATASVSFEYTGGPQYFDVPIGVTSIVVHSFGGQGGHGEGAVPGGRGGSATATLAVTPGETLQLNVGGRGGNSPPGAIAQISVTIRPGVLIAAYAVGALENVPYRLVLGTGESSHACTTIVQVLNQTIVYAGPSGLIGRVRGTLQPGLSAGTYKLCFENASSGNVTGTGGATFTVLPA